MDQTEKHCLLHPLQSTSVYLLCAGCFSGPWACSGRQALLVMEWSSEQIRITQGGDCKCGEGTGSRGRSVRSAVFYLVAGTGL